MKNEKTAIGFLTITAILLLGACLLVNTEPPKAHGAVTIKDRDFMVVTSPLQTGGDGLYITDTRTGQMAVFVYDNATRSLQLAGVLPLTNVFGGR